MVTRWEKRGNRMGREVGIDIYTLLFVCVCVSVSVCLCVCVWYMHMYIYNMYVYIHTHTYTHKITSKNLLYTIVNSTQYSVMAYMGKWSTKEWIYVYVRACPSTSPGKESACNVGDPSLIPRSGRCTGGGQGSPLHYSCLKNPHGQRSLSVYTPRSL